MGGLRPSGATGRTISFEAIVNKLTKKGSAEGFKSLRDLLLTNYNEIKHEFGPVNVLSLAISCDRHALFAKVTEDKASARDDAGAYDRLQDYLSGKSEVYEAMNKETTDGEHEGPVSEGESGSSDDEEHADTNRPRQRGQYRRREPVSGGEKPGQDDPEPGRQD